MSGRSGVPAAVPPVAPRRVGLQRPLVFQHRDHLRGGWCPPWSPPAPTEKNPSLEVRDVHCKVHGCAIAGQDCATITLHHKRIKQPSTQ